MNALEQENDSPGADKGTSDAQCMDVGGGSFFIDCFETGNKYAGLAEDWTDWREYYSSIPAPPPPPISALKQSRNKIKKTTV